MLTLNDTNISLDRREPGSDIDFVSHAHSDHTAAVRSSKMLLASDQTIQLIERASGKQVARPETYKGVRLLEAGHMLGSRQLCVDDASTGKRIIYTGDFQMEGSKTSRPIEITQADTVILDSTYCEPWIEFEKKEDIEAQIREWTQKELDKGIVLFTAYAMGKAQELIAILNDAGITPIVSKKISRVCGIYTKNGIGLEYASVYDEGSDYESIMKGGFVGITDARNLAPLRASLSEIHNRDVSTAVVTGWSKVFRFDTDMQFPFSDHADFKHSLEYINSTGAKNVYTYGPNSGRFAENLQKLGYDATPFSLYSAKR
ncbi:MAG: hypothetical protein KGH60_04150 [Candidatus Micrarchaeota archaeon]|nr:hypothetical protein [Candidatus Micrarchaeota archaeon]